MPHPRTRGQRARHRRPALRRGRRARRRAEGGTRRRRDDAPLSDELLLFEPSDLPTLEVTVAAGEPDDLGALLTLFAGHGYGAEHASSVRMLCACCSEGTHEQRRTEPAGVQRVSLAAPEDEARRLLEQWAGEMAIGRSWSGLAAVG
ncbi:hypothetical protein AB0A66_02430 [Streptomyces longwoodensis]|uniref:hypothetical protein n=1 Tax=Streptomyces longwoodensis TaxID=68231 RepID=UPI0033E016C1